MTREEAINILRETHDNALFSVRTALETLAPELKESEDERIRKMLIEKVEKWHEKALENNMVQDIKDSADIITYLEKQKDSNDMAFHEGYTLGFDDGVKSVERKEQKPRWEINNPHTTKWTWEMINEKFDELCGLERPKEREADNETEVRKACDQNTGEKIRENGGWIITPHKEFFKWIYERLIHVHKENPNVDYMRSLKERIDNMPSDELQWKPTDSHLRFLRAVVNDPKNAGAESCHIALKSLLEEIEKL